MRSMSVLGTTALLLALSQPAFAACINRGGALTCAPDPKYWTPTVTPAEPEPSEDPAASLKAIVLQPEALEGNAWVMTPGAGDGAADSAPATVLVCGSGANCYPLIVSAEPRVPAQVQSL